ncbi:hypothetical protein CR155_08965 [Pollutimonas nitritireducens]|uniref:DUF883 domain-containing protein n=1 Tax=Pollutimonas nitritireducens TaxID=2045209 RepID=A0A2N4UH82_9BURK|nr:DUF883 family protein [Pollutimonas nitritireducens]PLC54383.1 hypothetical protein CR155_08965 [Pollutimonas nitritireducens]
MTDHTAPDLNEMLKKATQLLQDTASYTGADIEAARARLRQQLEAVQDLKARQGWLAALCGAPLSRAVNQCVHEHTWSAIGAATLLGMLAGHCVARRH